jgi:hypothetical protein
MLSAGALTSEAIRSINHLAKVVEGEKIRDELKAS